MPNRLSSARFELRRLPLALSRFLLAALLTVGLADGVLAQAPSAPSFTSATAGNTQIVLVWAASSGATSYSVFRGTSTGGESTTAIQTGITATTWTDTGVSNGTTYYYKLKAVNSSGSSAYSSEKSATPVLPAPTLSSATAGDHAIALAWTSVTNAVSYSVFRGTSAGGESTTAIQSGITATTWTDSSASNGTTYYYKVKAVDSTSTSAASNEKSAAPVLTAPSGLSSTAGNGTIALTWTGVANATSYSVFRGTSSNGESTTAVQTGLTSASWTDTTVTNGTTYYYKVKSVDSTSTSAYSNETNAKPALSAPTGLTATAGTGQISLSWGSVANATSYNLYRGTTAGGESTTAYKTGLTSPSYTDTAVTTLNAANGYNTYYYKVKAFTGTTGSASYSNEAFSTALPSVVTGVAAYPSNGLIYIRFTDVNGANSYNIKRATTSGGPYTTVQTEPQPSFLGTDQVTDSPVTNGTTYYYVVTAVNASGETANSSQASATPIGPTAVSCGQTVNGSLTTASDRGNYGGYGTYADFYSLSGIAGNSVAITVTSSFSNSVYLYDPSGNQVTPSSYVYNGSVYVPSFYFATTGTYTLELDGGTTGSYTMTVSCSNGPVAPILVTATPGDAQVTVGWQSDAGATGYNVKRSTTSGGPYTTVGSPTTNSFTDTGLTNGTTYYYVVSAVNANGESGNSPEVSAEPIAAPVAPDPVIAGPTSTTVIQIEWQTVANASSYKIEQSPDGSTGWTQIGSSTSFLYNNTGLTPNTTYYYRVRGVNSIGVYGPYSSVVHATTHLPPPSGLTATASGTQVTLSWTAASGATTYHVFRATTSGFELGSDPFATVTGATTYTYTPSPALTYYYVVTSVDAGGGDSTATNEATAQPAAPTGLTATPGSLQATLSWSAVTGATSYHIERSATSGGPYTVVGTATSGTTYTDTGLNAVTYYYVVTALSAGGESGISNEASALPTGPSGSVAYHINAGGPAVSPYDADEDYSGGDISVGTPNLDTSGVTNPAPADVYNTCRFGSFSYSLPGLSPNATYTVRLHFVDPAYTLPGQRVFDVSLNGTQVLTNFDIVAQTGKEGRVVALPFTTTADSGGNIGIVFTPVVDSPLVNAIDVTTGTGSPGPALSLQASPGNAQVVLTWSGVNAATYNVKRSLTRGGPYTTIATGVTAQTYTDTGLTDNTPYYYVVSGVDSTGEGPNSNEASAIPSADITGSSALKIDCGGGEIDPFAADQGFTGGDAFSNPMWIDLSGATAPAPTGVYLSAREGTFNYTVTGLTPASAYTLRLHFAEIGSDVYAPGQRIFDVTANGSTVLSAFDITGAAGTTGRAIVEQENVTADSTGTIVIGTSPVLGDAPMINGFEVISGGSAPSAPYNLIASSGNAQVTLAWGGVTDATSYNVKRSSTSGGPYTTIGTSTTTAYTDSPVTNGQTYYYVVSAVNAVGESDNSNQAEGDPEASSGAVIRINSGGGQVGPFSYDQDFSGGGQDYLTSSIDTSGVANAAPAAVYQSRRFVFGSASYTIPNLTPSGQYTVRLHFADFPTDLQQQRLTSITINGASAFPNYDIAQSAGDRLRAVVEQWNTTADSSGNITIGLVQSGGDPGQINGLEILNGYSVPSAPRNLIALPDNAVVQLYWNAKNGVTGFTVKRGTASGGPYTTLASGLTSTTYTDSTAVNGTTYYYVVTATNATGESLPSNEATAEPLAAGAVEYKVNAGGSTVPPFVFDQYNNGGGEVSTTSAIDLSRVTNPAPMAVYQTVRAAAFGFTYTFPRLVPGETYTVRLHFAEIGNDVGGPGGRYEGVTINGATVLNAFDIFQAADGGNKAVVEQFTTTADASGQIAVVFLAQVNAPIVSGLEIDTGASYPPSPPQNLRAIAGNTSVGLSWVPSIGATSYRVKRGTTSGGPYTTIATGVTATTYTDPVTPASNTYFYVVTAVNANGESDPSNEAQPVPPFTLSANPAAVTVVQGGAADTTIAASSAVDFTAPITVSTSTPPTDMDVWSYPGEIDLFEQFPYPDSTMTANTKLHLFAASDTPVGTYTLTVTGTSGDYTAATTVIVTVVAP